MKFGQFGVLLYCHPDFPLFFPLYSFASLLLLFFIFPSFYSLLLTPRFSSCSLFLSIFCIIPAILRFTFAFLYISLRFLLDYHYAFPLITLAYLRFLRFLRFPFQSQSGYFWRGRFLRKKGSFPSNTRIRKKH